MARFSGSLSVPGNYFGLIYLSEVGNADYKSLCSDSNFFFSHRAYMLLDEVGITQITCKYDERQGKNTILKCDERPDLSFRGKAAVEKLLRENNT